MDTPKTIGQRVRRLRAQRGLTQDQLGDFASRTGRWVWNLENGYVTTLKVNVAQGLAFGLGCSVSYLLGTADGDDDDVKRREFLGEAARRAAGLALTPALDLAPWDRLAHVLSRPSSIDSATLTVLETATTALEALEYDVPPRGLIGPLSGHLTEIARLLEGSIPPSARQHLLSLAAEASATIGWLKWDLDEMGEAEQCWRVAAAAARDAGDRPLEAFVATSTSFRHRDDASARLAILRPAEAAATPRTLAWIRATEAESHALLGEEADCLRAMDRASAVMAALGDDRTSRRPRYDPYDEARLLADRGSALVKLATHPSGRFRRRGAEARDQLEQAISDMQGQPRMVHSMRASLARALAQLGDVEGATHTAQEAFDGAAGMGVQTIITGTLTKVVRELEPWYQEPAVRALRERLAS
jgi:transcriptional regulator with XRE-family HTH domain